jgi:LEA14-like dessication related protein
MRRRALCLAGLVALGACAGPLSGDLAPPEVALAGLSFARADLLAPALTVRLRVRNPNGFEIPVNALRFALALDDRPFADGQSAAPFTLPVRGETEVPITVAIPLRDLLTRVAAFGTGRRLDYRLTGEAEIGRLLSLAVPFTRTGQLALPAIPGLGARSG